MTLVPATHRLLAAAVGGLVLGLGPVVALAQTADPELSCVPDTVAAGASMSCSVTGVTASRAVDLELRSGATVLAAVDGVAGTDGTATLAVPVPDTSPTGALAVALVGTSVSVPVTVEPARPTGVRAGLGPSAGDVPRALPAVVVLAAAIALSGALLPGLRRRGTGRTVDAA